MSLTRGETVVLVILVAYIPLQLGVWVWVLGDVAPLFVAGAVGIISLILTTIVAYLLRLIP